MKALTVKQPWASLLVHGVKRYETRSWTTRYRGPLAIHASQLMDVAAATHPLVLRVLDTIAYEPSDLPLGAIVGAVRLEDVHSTPAPGVLSDAELALGDHGQGRYAWQLSCPVPIHPIPSPGSQSLWRLPEEIAAEVVRAVYRTLGLSEEEEP